MPSSAVIEELLRRLPGMRIDADGTISYNGERIQHLQVDGEDIFGSDPTMITRNFDANKIARVQILDRKSDKAVFTGFDDGARIKTLNLVLKSEARNGYFGKADVGGSPGGYYTAAAVVAGFRDKEQLTIMGMSGNTGMFSGSSNSGSASANAGFLYSISDPMGATAGKGVPRFNAISLHYASNNLGDHLNVDYQNGYLWTHPTTTTNTLQTIADGFYIQRQLNESINKQDQHFIRGQYERGLDKRMALQIIFHGNLYQNGNQYWSTSSIKINDIPTNNSLRSISDQGTGHDVGADASWRVRISQRMDKTLSISAGVSDIRDVTSGYLYSTSHFSQSNGNSDIIDTVNERKQIEHHSLGFHGGMAYMQPIYPGANLGFSYIYSVFHDGPVQKTFNWNEGKFDEAVDSLTSEAKEQIQTNIGMVTLQAKSKNLTYTVGLDIMDYVSKQLQGNQDSVLRLHYRNWVPKILLIYSSKPTRKFTLTYSSKTQQPTFDQLAPIKSNNDPLHILIGNPGLKPVTTQHVQIGIQVLRSWMIGTGMTFALPNGAIGTRTTIDILGRQVSQSVNLTGKPTATVYLHVNHTMGGVDWGGNITQIVSQQESYVSNDINQTENYTADFGLSATKSEAGKYFLQIKSKFDYLYSRNSINSSATLRYWTQAHSLAAAIYFFPHYEFGSSATYNWQQRTNELAGSSSVILWNMYINRTLVQDRLVLKAVFNNILNQNSGIIRSSAANVTTETATNLLGRYWMLSIIYHFDKKFNKK